MSFQNDTTLYEKLCKLSFYSHTSDVMRSPKKTANEERISFQEFTRLGFDSISLIARYSILNNEAVVGKAPLDLVTLRMRR